MSNQQRDSAGKYSAAAAISSATDPAPFMTPLAGRPAVPDGSAAIYDNARSMGYGSNESGTEVRTALGPSQHGRDVPADGVPGPADPTPAGGMPPGGLAGAADTSGAELADLGPQEAMS
jgi:hypothetical protein